MCWFLRPWRLPTGPYLAWRRLWLIPVGALKSLTPSLGKGPAGLREEGAGGTQELLPEGWGAEALLGAMVTHGS